ncbi:efflux RND transporter periplasmic adaptor subunit [Acuticoccus sp. MNP-M23]|uniref:efflux RND transporter periplasmic adaptor subunit n=1 Tax=Acuticoccus sp. MNP-M23 TaxID=3072793 RepID=UPI002814B90E|nr:efflux RND transporter periplasmic adaptor subunit [Acuticoccus sp. MNP-M23]WMS42828.1 efflux RND transporter periplasmic adaptor subunit [Acuticoccus sp. MNP-M23]
MKSIRQVVTVGVIAALGVGGYIYYQEVVLSPAGAVADGRPRGPRTITVEVMPAETHRLGVVIEAVGSTRAQRSVDIVPSAEGRVTETNIAAGLAVTTGTVLARLDDDIEKAMLAEAEATLEEKTAAQERAETLLRSNNVSRASIDQVRAELAIASAVVDRARRGLADRTVVAPFDGVLGLTSIDIGARVDTSTVLTTLDDLSAVEIEFGIPETYFGQIREGQPITATTAAFPGREFQGVVDAVDSRIAQTTRAFRVRARLPNEERTLPAGMFMRLSLSLGERDVVAVSDEAILVQGGDSFVFVVEDGKAARRRVTTGLRRNNLIEVKTGVSDGEAVIARGLQSLRDGSQVEVLTPATPAPDPAGSAESAS